MTEAAESSAETRHTAHNEALFFRHSSYLFTRSPSVRRAVRQLSFTVSTRRPPAREPDRQPAAPCLVMRGVEAA